MDDNYSWKYHIKSLEEEIDELKKEIDELKKENGKLREQIIEMATYLKIEDLVICLENN